MVVSSLESVTLLNRGVKFSIFQSFGTTPVLREQSKTTLRIGAIELCISYKTPALIPSGPAAVGIEV